MTNTPLRPARSAPPRPEPPANAPRRGRKPWIAGGVLALVAAGVATYTVAGNDSPPVAPRPAQTSAAVASAEPQALLTALPAGATASEGTLAVSVTGTECGLASLGEADLPLAADGEFCLVSVAVQNKGQEPRLLDPGAQRAVDAAGRSHRVAEQAAVFVNDQDPSLLDEIPAGAIREGVVPFDVPRGTRLTALVLHESPDSTGVRVPLS
ncbi:DUF4352 domain-containing protein [Actinoplanes sp. URMC 104]|uniref:DUF4352 domain-containing protein n=1 Tax=Actinoplanes sp. URMC 104 TaxID=3423409 RepID=UPI003F1C6138